MGDLFVELLFEEMPVSMIRPALEALRDGLLGLLEGVEHGEAETFATPRRLAVHVAGLAEGRPLVEKEVTGPPAAAAWQGGAWTKAALGFARGRGAAEADLRLVDGPRGQVVAVTVKEGGERAADLVAAGLERLVLGLPFAKSMEWGQGGVRFGRPLHAVSALLDGRVIPATVAGLEVGNRTLGHRLAESPSFHFHTHREWLEGLRARKVEPDAAQRKRRVAELLAGAAAELGADPIEEPDLLEEVTFLVEWPEPVIGTFDADLLDLPHRLLVQAMKQHQRYFPVHRGGRLTHEFVVVSNNPWGEPALIAEGNARVLRARFYDARFFLAEDRKRTLEEHGRGLQKMRWIRGLGTMADKQRRIAALAERLAPLTGADPDVARRAGALSKADLVTLMVGEFPELQGHMGRLYAPDGLGRAIEEHYLPQKSDDPVPASPEGAAVALADRIDTLVGCFAIGMVPKGSGDPQGLRRAASGLLRILAERDLRVDLSELFEAGLDVWRADPPQEKLELASGPLVDFTLARFKAAMVAEGVTSDVVDAVVAVTVPDPLVLRGKVAALAGLAGSPDFEPILQTFKRVLNISRGASYDPPDRDALRDPAEAALARSVDAVGARVLKAAEELRFEAALQEMLELQAPVAAFFDAVLVDDPDAAVKARRLGLLQQAAGVFRNLADFSRISSR